MKFEERSFSGKKYRPRPEFRTLNDDSFVLVATPWGPRESAKHSIESVSEFVTRHYKDPEATSPFPKIPALSDISNAVRIGALIANEDLNRSENKEEYKCGVELFAGMKMEREVSWIHVGQPHVILLRVGRPPLALSTSIDLSMEFSQKLDPLPSDCLGLQAIPPLFVHSFRAMPDDKILLLSYNWLPEILFTTKEHQWNIDELSKQIISENPNQPFWIGVWDLSG